MSEKTIFTIAVFLVVPFVVAWFHHNANRTSSNWSTYLVFSIVAVLLSPIILKTVGNDSIADFLGKDIYEYFQLLSYVTLVGVGGYGVVQKLVADIFGDVEKKRLKNLETTAQASLAEKIDSANLKSVNEFLEFIQDKKTILAKDIPSEFFSAFEEAKKNSLINLDINSDLYSLSTIGKVYVAGSN